MKVIPLVSLTIVMLACVDAAGARSSDAPAVLPPGGAGVLTWTPAQQAWGYKHMELMNPSRVIKRGDKVHVLRKAAVQIDPRFDADGKSYNTASYMTAFRASGVLVIQDGKIILERYGLGRRPHDRWTSFSVAKSITSTLIGAAIKDGKIKSLDDPVTYYIPELAPREAAPGSKFVYKTGETDLAGILLSNAVGEPLSKYLSEKIWRPYGMEQDGIWSEDLAGHERGGCCMSMTLRDYGRFGLFTLDQTVGGGHEVLPAGWMRDATSVHVTEPPYGYFWWLTPGGYEAEGIFGQSVSVFPTENLVVVINSAWPAAWDKNIARVRRAYIQAIRTAASKRKDFT
jgi:CubicO group peptidase (beta-lactamase class C family)